MRIKTGKKVRFPRGYKYEEVMEASTGIMESGKINGRTDNDLPVCPIHGKNCKKQNMEE